MKKQRAFLGTCTVSLLIMLSACNTKNTDRKQVPESVPAPTMESTQKKVNLYEDIRYFEGVGRKKEYKESEFNKDDIVTFTFNQDTVLLGSEELQTQIMENGKNPGLGIRELHKQGITGKGVNVAIIDQNLLLHHPEFSGKIAAYYDAG